jgi:hypothetical protein
MDDVKAMTRAGETVGKAVSSGWLAARRSAKRAGQTGAEVLADGVEVARQEVKKTSRRARRKLAKTAKHTRKDLAKAAKQARKDVAKSKAAKQARKMKTDAAAKLANEPKQRKRRWPKLMLLAIVASGIAYVVRGRAAAQQESVPEPRRDEPAKPASAEADVTPNGQPRKSTSSKS